ncbi:hypothetical protein JX265_009757 [Neoarthrinium moseri]|uniref:GPI inositol-deacylase n=1 Tax=Neoarthrinium moseri TaxID=1658444 RepID=A0A9P9WFV1_9PEZI|nr:hypothetical protein JX265_009757 [Neoarthrinium moseri]
MDPPQAKRPGVASGASSVVSAKTFLARSFSRRDTQASDVQDPSVSTKGPLGLTTVHEPGDADAAADLVFVHGLNGGSMSTWSKGGDANLFWPGEFLPRDAFQDVRIHTFGYSSGVSRESVLNIQDFARSLLAAVQDAPTMSKSPQPRLIFIGHSMGGLVIKKAFIMGTQIPEFQSLVARTYAIFFLATPHQGADIAQTLSRLLALAPGSRPFVNDLFPQSPALQSINDEFPRVSGHLQLFSFYETKSMNYGVGKGLIVEKHAAVMNAPNERKTPLDADHRNAAMYASQNDPSYVSVRNALVTVVQSQRESSKSSKQELERETQMHLDRYLGIQDAPEDDIMTQDTARLAGSCEWLLRKDYFSSWRQGIDTRFLWLRGRPGTGKSVLTGHVVNTLRSLGFDCCFFFFSESDHSKSTVNSFLRSMAWQLAMLNEDILEKVGDLSSDWSEMPIDKIDHNLVWRRLYGSGLLKVKLSRPLYWVIDAMDECKASADLMGFLARAQQHWPLSIFVTSRDPPESHVSSATAAFSDLRTEVISDEDSNQDISLFLQTNLHLLPWARSETWSTPEEFVDHITKTAKGCFLWAYLVFTELRQVHTSAEIRKVLETNPSDIDSLYAKILTDMSNARFGKPLAKALLTWATYSFRPLSIHEARVCIEMDIHDTIDDVERSISTCCGNLVYVDRHNKMQLIHLTAREFLTRKDLTSDLVMDRKSAHRRMVMVCLRYLMGEDQKQGSSRPRSPQHGLVSETQNSGVLQEYASTSVFQHLHQVDSTDEAVLVAVSKFLQSPKILSWIEFLASKSNLAGIFYAGKTLRNFLDRRSRHSPPLSLLPINSRKDISVLERWANDLKHLPSRFSRWLRATPSCIHQLIPPFCPRHSIIRQQFSSPYKGLSVQGLSETGWNECITTITYPRGTKLTTVSSGDGYFALGMMNGKVIIYGGEISQEMHTLSHGEPVWRLAFSQPSNGKDQRTILASAGGKSIKLWDPESGLPMLRIAVDSFCLALAFTDDNSILRAVTKKNQLYEWDVETGALLDNPTDWTQDLLDEGTDFHYRAPQMAEVGSTAGLLCITYRGEDLVLWDYLDRNIHDIYEKHTGSRRYESTKLADGTTTVNGIAFSEQLDFNMLAISYWDGDLALYNTLDGSKVQLRENVNATLLVASPDSRTLAAADSRGNIKLFDFASLNFLYCIQFPNNHLRIKSLTFTPDSMRLIEIRGDQCRVWEPSILLRQGVEDENSDTVSISVGPEEIDYESREGTSITALTCANTPNLVFCGKEDGSVHVFDTGGPEPQSHQLFVQTAGCPIQLIHFESDAGILCCADVSGRVTGRQISRQRLGQRTRWDVSSPLINQRPMATTTQILSSGSQSRMIISTEQLDSLWQLPASDDSSPLTKLPGNTNPRWLQHFQDQDYVFFLGERQLRICKWHDLECIRVVDLEIGLESLIGRVIPLQNPRVPQFFVTATQTSGSRTDSSTYHVWDAQQITEGTTEISPTRDLGRISSKVESIVGSFGYRIVLCSSDYWICSVDLQPTPSTMTDPDDQVTSLARHFFIPSDWNSVAHRLIMGMGPGGDISVVRQGEFAVIKRGLEITENGGSFTARRGSGQQPQQRLGLPRRPAMRSGGLHTAPF